MIIWNFTFFNLLILHILVVVFMSIPHLLQYVVKYHIHNYKDGTY